MSEGPTDALHDLRAYFERLAARREEGKGAVRLVSERSAVIAANAAYPLTGPAVAPAALVGYVREKRPVVAAGEPSVRGAREVLRLRWGVVQPDTVRVGADGAQPLVVEQVSRLQASLASELLCRAWGMPEWSSSTARWLERALESVDHQLYVGYADGPVGVALVLDGAAHLWGSLRPELAGSLLTGAALAMGAPLRTSVPVSGDFSLPLGPDASERNVTYWMAES